MYSVGGESCRLFSPVFWVPMGDIGQSEELTGGCHISRGILGISHGRCKQEGGGGGKNRLCALWAT